MGCFESDLDLYEDISNGIGFEKFSINFQTNKESSVSTRNVSKVSTRKNFSIQLTTSI